MGAMRILEEPDSWRRGVMLAVVAEADRMDRERTEFLAQKIAERLVPGGRRRRGR